MTADGKNLGAEAAYQSAMLRLRNAHGVDYQAVELEAGVLIMEAEEIAGRACGHE